jgi:hypothetical protein
VVIDDQDSPRHDEYFRGTARNTQYG